ncbi:CRISPR-associated helicase Cas3' [Streptomyces sp. NPDC004111]|uniref:CRISPR-associated helicase Cas3' n=1 Tax=Streptomyces sp. NPDC004111 TaxID=3364690 RepID=UPI0036ACE2A7
MEDGRQGGLDLSPWGKYFTWYGRAYVYPVLFHMLDVAAVAGELWDRFLTPPVRQRIADGLGLSLPEARAVAMFLCGCHDLGKVSRFLMCEPRPWARISDALKADTRDWRLMRHERASMHILLGILSDMGYPTGGNDSPAVRAAQVPGGHHGWFWQLDLNGAARRERVHTELGGPLWQDLRRRYAEQIRHLTGAIAIPTKVTAPAAVLLTGLTMLADRLASQKRVWVRRSQMSAYGASEHYPWARWMARGVVRESQLTRVPLPEVPFAVAHPDAGQPNPLQESVRVRLPALTEQKGPGILVVMDSTGAGKTLTALEAARIFNANCATEGIAYMLPTTAAADATYDVLYSYVKCHGPSAAVLSLLHNHSFLNQAYTSQALAPGETATCSSEEEHEAAEDEFSSNEDHTPPRGRWAPDGWLRGWNRALLAQYTVTTEDQGVMAVLPVRYSALRMLALSGRTVVLDEVHAFTPFTLKALGRLLHWLGALGTPVVVLSATLPQQIAEELVRSYLAGAGHRRRDLLQQSYTTPYPGWLFADARTASCTVIDPPDRKAQAALQRRSLAITVQPVTYRRLGNPERGVDTDERLAHIARALDSLGARGGCATVACATVADAQDTYQHLLRRLNWPDGTGNLELLHARFPAYQREATMRRVRTALGKAGPRPHRLVVVTTSLLEMSLDVDTDFLITDLTSMARLLQSVGRLWRFDTPQHRPVLSWRRAPWLAQRGPQALVLHPVENGATVVPGTWTSETAFRLAATAAFLTAHPEHQLTLPDGVAALVGAVHGPSPDLSLLPDTLGPLLAQQQAKDRAQEHASAGHLVPPHDRVGSLADLHRQNQTAARAPTRPGTRPRRILACFRQSAPGPTLDDVNGHLTLDREGRIPLPQGPRLSSSQVRAVLEHTLTVPGAWVEAATARHGAPEAWHHHPLLADLVLLEHDPHRDTPVRLGRHLLYLDRELGLVHHEN